METSRYLCQKSLNCQEHGSERPWKGNNISPIYTLIHSQYYFSGPYYARGVCVYYRMGSMHKYLSGFEYMYNKWDPTSDNTRILIEELGTVSECVTHLPLQMLCTTPPCHLSAIVSLYG